MGVVESLGRGVKEVKEGERVAISWMGYACGSCGYCVSGWETLCERLGFLERRQLLHLIQNFES
jgi:propanol-preferring alcohol dehydrogenase